MALSQSSKILVSDINSALAGKQDALGYTPVKSVNGTSADSSGNVTISATPSTVKGIIGSAVAVNGTSLALPSGGTWFVWNVGAINQATSDSSGASYVYGTGSASGNSSTGFASIGKTYSGGTTVYAKKRQAYEGLYYSDFGKLAAIRIA